MRLAFLTIILLLTSTCHADDDRVGAGRAAALAAEANLSALKNYKCRYTITKAVANSLTDALSRKYENARQCEYFLASDGKSRVVKSITRMDISPPRVFKEGVNPSTGQKGEYFSVDFAPVAELRRVDTGLSYTPEWKQAVIIKDNAASRDDVVPTPLSVARWGNSKGLRDWREAAESGKAVVSSLGTIQDRGMPCVHLKYGFDSKSYSLYFDPSRGYLSARTSVEGLQEAHTYLVNAKDVGAGRWFPMHYVTVVPGSAGGRMVVKEIRVSELEMDSATDSDLGLELAAGTAVFREDMPIGAGEYIKLRQDEVVKPSDLTRLESMCKEAPLHRRQDTALNRQGTSKLRWYLLFGATVTFVAAWWVYQRRASHSRPNGL